MCIQRFRFAHLASARAIGTDAPRLPQISHIAKLCNNSTTVFLGFLGFRARLNTHRMSLYQLQVWSARAAHWIHCTGQQWLKSLSHTFMKFCSIAEREDVYPTCAPKQHNAKDSPTSGQDRLGDSKTFQWCGVSEFELKRFRLRFRRKPTTKRKQERHYQPQAS